MDNCNLSNRCLNDPANTPISDLSLGNPFKGMTTTLAYTGSTDFNGDNKTDVFRTYLRGDGTRQWQYSSGGTGAWQDLAFADDTPLQFGAFNNDAKSDVFANLYNAGLTAYQWLYSPGGTGSFVTLNSTAFPPARLALGDFNGDGVTDVFTATNQGGTYQWGYTPGGNGSLVSLAHSAIDPALLRFGDFNGDGKTDVFAATQQSDGSTQWLYSSSGAASYTNLVTTTVPYAELQFGDFDGDGKTDVLAALPQNDGRLKVIYWPHGLGPIVTLGYMAAPAPALRVGDFNGDGISDLLAWRCGMKGPLTFGPRQTLATSVYGTFYQALTGDVNGDGRPDVIVVSTCQNPTSFGSCATHHLQVGAALGQPDQTNTLVAPQTLSTDSFEYWKVLAGDFDGDGKTDLALVYPSGSSLTIQVAHSNGDGHFHAGCAAELRRRDLGHLQSRSWAILTAMAKPTWPSPRYARSSAAVVRLGITTASTSPHPPAPELSTWGRARIWGRSVGPITMPLPAISTAMAKPIWFSTRPVRKRTSPITPARLGMPTTSTRLYQPDQEVSP